VDTVHTDRPLEVPVPAARPTAVLRVEPHMLPGLIAAYRRAAEEMGTLLEDVSRRGRIEVPWTQDPVSVAMTEHYNHVVMDGEYSTYAALRQYEQELLHIVEALTQMDTDYRRTEDATASQFQQL